jgi:hypothetical protein
MDLQQFYLPVRDFKFFWNRRHSFSLNTRGDSSILKSHPFALIECFAVKQPI